MPPSPVETRLAELRAEILRHDRLYYTEGVTEISDAEYDALMRELVESEREHPELVTPDSPTQRVGAPLPEGQGFPKVVHEVPMLSIESLFSADEAREFGEKIRRFLKLEADHELFWSVEPKFDGVSASLLFEDGNFVRGVTRGDGVVGEDITANLRTVRNLPLRLIEDPSPGAHPIPTRLEVRGEVVIRRDAFALFNAVREEAGQTVLANPRNATSGALRRNDPAEVARYPLEFHSWAVAQLEGAGDFATHTEVFSALRGWGLPDSGLGQRVAGLDACLAYHAELEAKRFEIPFDMDGVVAKLDSLELRERLGRTARSMRWQYAHKFAPIGAVTTLLAIDVQVGVNGRLTPRAYVAPVEIGGVTVRHTTLHNVSHVHALDVRIGDRVAIERAGDVIPQVMGLAKRGEPKDAKGWEERLPDELFGASTDGERVLRPGVEARFGAEFTPPERCPACGTPVEVRGKYYLCPNGLECPPQLVGRTQLLSGRSAFEIDRLGKKNIEQLVDAGLLQTPADLFHLEREGVLALERWGEKSVDNLFEQLEQRRRVPFDRFLVALAIPEVGTATAKLLARHFASFDDLVAADEAALADLGGIGEEMARAIHAHLRSPVTLRLVERLFEGGVELVHPTARAAGGALAGRTLVFTGTLPTLSRAEAKRLAEGAGAKVTSSISKQTDFLVTGAKAGSKRQKAEDLGVAILDEAEFLALADKTVR
ncbi:MAG: NAD-dependent DNA ligase LigA [Planctomycetota bacterium]